ncbi:hypothetical protein FAGKG844_190096 [Frankia sp. AgKG'84/4]
MRSYAPGGARPTARQPDMFATHATPRRNGHLRRGSVSLGPQIVPLGRVAEWQTRTVQVRVS